MDTAEPGEDVRSAGHPAPVAGGRAADADQWIGGRREEDPHAALLQVLRRFMAAYGPTTPQDFARWFAASPATARDLFTQLGRQLVEVDVAGQLQRMLAGDVDEPVEAVRDLVRLVPQYDGFTIGSRPREQLLTDAAQERIRSYRRGRFEGVVALPALLLDGLVAGIGERRKRGDGIEITVEPAGELSARQHKRLAADADRVGAFLGAGASLTVGALS